MRRARYERLRVPSPGAFRRTLLLLTLVGVACSSGGSGGGSGGGSESGGGGGAVADTPAGSTSSTDPPAQDPPEEGASGGGGAEPLPLPSVRGVTLGWRPSPTPGVQGYLLSIGTRSGVYGSALVVRNDQVTPEPGGMLSMELELPAELDHHLAMRAFDGGAVSIYSNEIFIPALRGPASAGGEAALLEARALQSVPLEAVGSGGSAEESIVESATGGEAQDSDASTRAVTDAPALRFELLSGAARSLDLMVTTPRGSEIQRTLAAADGCAYAGFEADAAGGGVEVVDCSDPALGPYMLQTRNGSGSALPAVVRVLEGGVERARFDWNVAAGGEALSLYEHALEPSGCPVVSVGREPLHQLGSRTYLGFEGGLHPGGERQPPSAHAAEGAARASRVQPLDASGRASEGGAIVVLARGTTNAAQHFEALTERALDDAGLRDEIVWVNGAGLGAGSDPGLPDPDRVRDEWLAPIGLSEAQVQVVWLSQASARPSVSLPDRDADAFALLARLADEVRDLYARYPNLQLVLLSSPIYAGYAAASATGEPYAYESGFAVKWLIEAQIRQSAGLGTDPIAGGLAWDVAPWLGWGPYLWGDGLDPRDDGLVWECGDFQGDGAGVSPSGSSKAGEQLHDFFRTSPFAAPWSRR